MSRHWSAFVSVSEKQARALDKMAKELGLADGQALLLEVGGCRPSKLSGFDRVKVQGIVDDAFAYHRKTMQKREQSASERPDLSSSAKAFRLRCRTAEVAADVCRRMRELVEITGKHPDQIMEEMLADYEAGQK